MTANLSLVQSLYSAFASRDRERILSIFHPDIEWIQNDGFPGGGMHKGAAHVLDDVLSQFRRDWDSWRARVTEWHDAGNTVIAIGIYEGTNKATGKQLSAAFAHIYDVKEGRITRFRQYTDTALVHRAVSRS
ncbi:MAG: nuclear transport factor 2 family protein [Phycisphaeraceae bacterium]|nr:nuclear transport factor 2 family protein [Phycisphaeraceae bacterium]